MDVGRSWARNAAAVARMARHLLTGPLLRPCRRTWGATPEEVATDWPGVELLPTPSGRLGCIRRRLCPWPWWTPAEAGTVHRTSERTAMTEKRTSKQVRRWSELSSGQQTAVLTLASIQVSLAVTAWTDLAFRPTEQVNGRKAVWAAVIAVNFVGPTLYFLRGIRR